MSQVIVEVEEPPPIQVSVDQVAVSVTVDNPETVVFVTEPNVVVEATEAAVAVSVAGDKGPKGDKGDEGDVGPPGPPGSAYVYTHDQSLLSPLWDIQHNMGKHPVVTVEDAAGSAIYGTITYIDNNRLTVAFSFNATGHAHCT